MRLDRYDQGGYAGGGITENGGNISGPLVLAGNPSQTLEAVPKQYVDAYFNSLNANNLTSGTLAAARLPNFTGDLQSNPGTSQFTLVNSGIVAGEYAKISVNAKGIATAGSTLTDNDIPFGLSWDKINPASLPTTLSGYGITDAINTSGGTLTGFLTLSIEPTLGTHAATKQYVDSLVSGGGIAVGDILRKPYSTTPSGFLKCNGAEVDKTTYSALYSIIGDQYKQNAVAGSGQPWFQQYEINTTQSSLNISNWTAGTNLPEVLSYHRTFVTKNRVYIVGYVNGASAYSASVYTAPINADGTLGAWALSASLPGACCQASVALIKNRVYIFGGLVSNAGAVTTSVYSAPVNNDGTLGTWVSSTALPSGRYASSVIVTKNKLYLIGGMTSNTTNTNSVLSTTISSDGLLGSWTTEVNLPISLGNSGCSIIKNYVYLIGGGSGGSATSSIYRALINADGSLGAWTLNSSILPENFSNVQVYTTNNRVYLLGGNNATNGVINIYSAIINTDGTLGTWIIGGSLPAVNFNCQIFITKNYIYTCGGHNSSLSALVNSVYSTPISGGLNDYSSYYSPDTTNYMMPGSGKPWKQQYEINTTQSADITGWSTTTSLPSAFSLGQVIVTKNRVYLLGGTNGTSSISTVYTAPINTDGTLGSWTTGIALPEILHVSECIVTKNRVYLLGGYTTTYVSTVYTAPINTDGTLGTWTTGVSLPGALGRSRSLITKNRVYLLGGYNGSAYTSIVYTAPINTDGTLGSWTTGIALPGALSGSQIVVTKNRVYLLGGYNGSAYISTAYMATINSDGLIGPWTTISALPGALDSSQVIVTKNRVYLLGGYNGSAYTSVVYTASINVDGTLGTWSTSTSLPGALGSSHVFVTKNRVYLCGGYNGGAYTSVVYTASILEGLNDYSPYYDGTIVPNDVVVDTSKFILPDFSADEPFGSYSYIKY